MKPTRAFVPLALLVTTAGLSGCQQAETDADVQSIRPIKTITLASRAEAVEQRSFPGLVRAASSSTLSFQVSGKVLEIEVDVGDRVAAGELLAVVDDEPFKLEVQSAEADLNKSKANYDNSAGDFDRKKGLRDKGYVSASDLDQALAERDAASNQVIMAQSRLDIAKRDLRNTRLEAPFAGYISKRLVEPHQEIGSGQELFQLDALGELEVELMLPENIIGRVACGDEGVVSFPGLKGKRVEGRIEEIGTLAGAANAFPVALRLAERPPGLYPGMTAEVELSIDRGGLAGGFLLPAAAVVARVGTVPGRHFVFVYDPGAGTVHKRPVFISGGQQNMARVSEGLEQGDIVAVAGASFLSDGMQVRLLEGPAP